jgi:hypothetical protein
MLCWTILNLALLTQRLTATLSMSASGWTSGQSLSDATEALQPQTEMGKENKLPDIQKV